MIDESERQEIVREAVNKAKEEILLAIPEVIGNLMSSHAALHKINTKFYADYPEFKDKKDVVANVVEMVEGRTPLAKYKDILREAIPKIRERINTLSKLDMNSVSSSPNRDLKGLDIPEAERPNPHGEI